MFKLVYVSCEKHRLWGPPPRQFPSPVMFYAIPQQDPISCLGKAMCPRATYPHNQVVKAGDIWATKLAALRRRRGTSEGCTEQDVLNLEVWMSVGAFICQQLYSTTVSLLFFILFQPEGWLPIHLPRSQQGRDEAVYWGSRGCPGSQLTVPPSWPALPQPFLSACMNPQILHCWSFLNREGRGGSPK